MLTLLAYEFIVCATKTREGERNVHNFYVNQKRRFLNRASIDSISFVPISETRFQMLKNRFICSTVLVT